MEKISSEDIICSLLLIGFDKIDSSFYAYTEEKLLEDNKTLKVFILEDKEFSALFKTYINYKDNTFSFKNGYSLKTNTSIKEGEYFPLEKRICKNRKLIEYFKNCDFTDILLKKIRDLNVETKEEVSKAFCKKEKELLKDMFDLEEKTKQKRK